MPKPPYLNVLASAVTGFSFDEGYDAHARHIVRKLKEAGYIIEPHIGRHTRPMWLALNSKNQVRAMWFRGCVQKFNSWRRAIRGLGYHPVLVKVVFPW